MKKKTKGLDPRVADRLLERLSEDDTFRKLFISNPTAALAEVGHLDDAMSSAESVSDDAASLIDGCLQVSQLASKDVIAGARDELRKMLTAGLSQTTPHLDAS